MNTKTENIFLCFFFLCLQFNYITAPTANNHHLNVNLVHQQQKPFVSHGPPYPSEHYCYETSGRSYTSSTPNNNSSTIRSVKNYRKPHPPSNVNYNIMNMNTSTTTSSNSSYSNPLTNNLNNNNNNNNSTYKFNNVSQSNNLNHSNISYSSKMGGGGNEQHTTVLPPYSNTNLSRRSSQSSGNHEWMMTSAEKAPHSLSLCINRINLKKSNNSNHSSSSSSSSSRRRKDDGSGGTQPPQFQSMRCRKHRNRNHFFNTSSSTSYQKYKLTKSCSNDTVNSSEQADLSAAVEIKNPQTTYKFI